MKWIKHSCGESCGMYDIAHTPHGYCVHFDHHPNHDIVRVATCIETIEDARRVAEDHWNGIKKLMEGVE
jgi:hypothetical protein